MARAIGVDIGSYSIKLIELQEKKGQLELVRSAVKAVSGEDGKASLKDLIAQLKLSSKRVNVSLSGPSVIVRYIDMPPMKKEELKSAIKFEAEKYLPFDIKEAIVDCTILDKGISGNSSRVLLVASKKDKVYSYVELFKEIGFEIEAIDVDTAAFLNAFQRAPTGKKIESNYAIVNIGARFSNMNIVSRDYPYFTRDILWGGMDITNKIKDSLNISLQDAEALKQRPGEKKNDVHQIILPVLEKFVSEIRLSFDYFETQFGKNIDRFYLSGGGSYLFNLMDFLKEHLGIEVLMWDPFEGIILPEQVDTEIKDYPAQFAVAVGLALRR